jgi:HEAT repeat protein
MAENDWRALAARFPALKSEWRNPGPAADPKTTAELLEQLKSDDMMARRDAARRLEGGGDESVTAAIVEAAKAEETSLRSILDESLGRMPKTEASLDFLLSELRSDTAANRKAALVALRKLTGQWFGDDASKWEAWRKSGGQ